MSLLIDSYCNKFGKIVELSSNNIIASGKIIADKNTINGKIMIKLSSFDNKYFFKCDGNNKYKLILTNTCDSIKFDINNYSYLKVAHWSTAIDNYLDESIDIYEENTYNELDAEVINICNALNSINGIETVGSCSGHNIKYAFINIQIFNLNSLLYLLRILSIDMFRDKFILTSDKTIIHTSTCKYPMLKLRTTDIGKLAYENLEKLTHFINSYE